MKIGNNTIIDSFFENHRKLEEEQTFSEEDKKIHESGDLKITGGGTISASCPLHNIIKYDYDHINDYYFNSFKRAPNEGENWIEFDFCDRKTNVTSYTLRTGSNQACKDAHPKS